MEKVTSNNLINNYLQTPKTDNKDNLQEVDTTNTTGDSVTINHTYETKEKDSYIEKYIDRLKEVKSLRMFNTSGSIKKDFSYVPDVLWSAFLESATNIKDMQQFSFILDIPKWSFEDAHPPKLTKIEPTEEEMLSYDYSKAIDVAIQEQQSYLERTPSGGRGEQYIKENLIFLNNVKSAFNDITISGNREIKDEISLVTSRWIYDFDENIQHRFEERTRTYAQKAAGDTVKEMLQEAGIPSEYQRQFMDHAGGFDLLRDLSNQFADKLKQDNSNAYDHLKVDESVSLEWLKNQIYEFFGEALEDMGKIGEPGNKWMDPELYDLKKAVEKGQK